MLEQEAQRLGLREEALPPLAIGSAQQIQIRFFIIGPAGPGLLFKTEFAGKDYKEFELLIYANER